VTITASDIKLFATERMTDTADGGGRRTGNVIPDGVPGNIFPKVSRLDSVYGRVNLRKIVAGVETPSLDTYAGAHAVIIDAPDNNNIHTNLFSTGSDFDDRTAARDRIESYVIAGPESRMVLYGRQLIGQRAIGAYQRVEEALPEVGEVFCLSHEIAGVVQKQQYVRVQDVKHEVRTFADVNGEFERRVLVLELTTSLRFEFPGQGTALRFANEARPTLIRRTSVADATHYYGIQPVTEGALAGALEMRIASVYSPIVPTTQRESPVSNAEIVGAAHIAAAGASRLAWMPVGPFLQGGIPNLFNAVAIQLPTAVLPGSLQIKVGFDIGTGSTNGSDGGGGMNPGIVADNGVGAVTLENPAQDGGAYLTAGAIDYESGVLTVSGRWANGLYSGRVWVSYIVAAPVSQPTHTLELPITLATRGTVFVQTLNPLPAKGTFFLDFRALGRWYRLRDDGTGNVTGDDPAYGVGTVDFVTGAAVITIGALPDVGSSALMGWASPVHYTIRAGATSDAGATVRQRIMLPDLPVKPSSVSVSYPAGVDVYTATETSAGILTGGGITGTVNHATGELLLEYTTRLPNMDTLVSVAYQQEQPTGATATSASGTVTVTDLGDIQLDTDGAEIAPKGLKMMIPIRWDHYTDALGVLSVADNGVGQIVTLEQKQALGNVIMSITGGQVVGTVNYATATVAITALSILATYNWWANGNAWVGASTA
jgi:hypothetical protein